MRRLFQREDLGGTVCGLVFVFDVMLKRVMSVRDCFLIGYCKVVKNFNSMFAILSGLGHGAVSRLRLSWDKVPAKYVKLFEVRLNRFTRIIPYICF